MVLTLEIVIAKLVLILELSANSLEWPVSLFPTEHSNITIRVLVARRIFNEANALLLLALATHAMVALHAETAWKKVLAQANHLFAVLVSFLVFELGFSYQLSQF